MGNIALRKMLTMPKPRYVYLVANPVTYSKSDYVDHGMYSVSKAFSSRIRAEEYAEEKGLDSIQDIHPFLIE
jgi:hypothetical protein